MLLTKGAGWLWASITAGFDGGGAIGPLGFFCLAFTSCFDGGGAILIAYKSNFINNLNDYIELLCKPWMFVNLQVCV